MYGDEEKMISQNRLDLIRKMSQDMAKRSTMPEPMVGPPAPYDDAPIESEGLGPIEDVPAALGGVGMAKSILSNLGKTGGKMIGGAFKKYMSKKIPDMPQMKNMYVDLTKGPGPVDELESEVKNYFSKLPSWYKPALPPEQPTGWMPPPGTSVTDPMNLTPPNTPVARPRRPR